MLVLHYNRREYCCKLILYIPGSANRFDGYHLIVQEAQDSNSTESILSKDSIYWPDFITIDANTIYSPCFVVETDYDNNIVILAKDREYWEDQFTLLHNENE